MTKESELPPLPYPPHYSANPVDAWEPTEDLWDAAQMQAYAAAAVLAERERCAQVCEDMGNEYVDFGEDLHAGTGMALCAAAIRKGETP